MKHLSVIIEIRADGLVRVGHHLRPLEQTDNILFLDPASHRSGANRHGTCGRREASDAKLLGLIRAIADCEPHS